jgi:hypothetical protein
LNKDVVIPLAIKLYFRNTNTYIQSSADHILKLYSDDSLSLDVPNIYMKNNAPIRARNGTNLADHVILNYDSSNVLQLGAEATSINMNKKTTFQNIVGGTSDIVIDRSTDLTKAWNMGIGAAGNLNMLPTTANQPINIYSAVGGKKTSISNDGSNAIISTDIGNISCDSKKLVSVADPTATQDAATKKYVDGTLQTLTLVNSWVVFDSPYDSIPAVWKIGNTVFIQGMIKSGSSSGSNQIATLPSGFRPSKRIMFPILCAAGLGRIDITSDGLIYPITTDSGWTSMCGILFTVI